MAGPASKDCVHNHLKLAIDPGEKGGIAWQFDESPAQAAKNPPDEGDLIHLLRGLQLTASRWTVYFELVGGHIGAPQPGSAMFTFGNSTGFSRGVLRTLGFRLEHIRPQTWQKPLGLGTKNACASTTEWKNKLKSEAARRFPHLVVTLHTADALLILDYVTNPQRSL